MINGGRHDIGGPWALSNPSPGSSSPTHGLATWLELEMTMGTRNPMGFYLLGYGFRSIFIPMSLLMGINVYPTVLWVRVCSYSTQTREPVGFLNPTKLSAHCHFIL
jgi:hypothetical protein